MALKAVNSLRDSMASLGSGTLSEVIVHHDKDSVYTSYAWLQRLLLEEGAGSPTLSEVRRTIPGSKRSGADSKPRAAD